MPRLRTSTSSVTDSSPERSRREHKLCGIDEAGRGPLAGDLVMAGVILKNDIEGLMDSKVLSEKKREALYPQIIENSLYHIVSFSPQQIDQDGLSKCLGKGLESIMENLESEVYLFDGNQTFGVLGVSTMVKADAKVPEVSAASILAKVTHDHAIVKASKLYPLYGFEKHKGYGTKAHVAAIKEHGYCDLHRRSFKVKGLS
ncbi:MAG: Ribonuclease HII (EC [uncultured Sulfurovum sp.]|uniref:Ribonuclease n=1 Tax=uncultured Sulfurovum sp. TaxID=269237 RepID=A0A6S6TCL5_9BACT|nr:MAG: Ribonuclease HII (EC [uncultured Sulfurovum sp.]